MNHVNKIFWVFILILHRKMTSTTMKEKSFWYFRYMKCKKFLTSFFFLHSSFINTSYEWKKNLFQVFELWMHAKRDKENLFDVFEKMSVKGKKMSFWILELWKIKAIKNSKNYETLFDSFFSTLFFYIFFLLFFSFSFFCLRTFLLTHVFAQTSQ